MGRPAAGAGPWELGGQAWPLHLDTGGDASQDTDPDQDGAQLDPTKVHPSDHTDRAVYHIDPRTSGMELRQKTRLNDGTDRPT